MDFHAKLPVTSLSEMDGLLLCGYEAPYTHNAGQDPITVGMLRVIRLHGEQPSVEMVIDPQFAPYAHEQRVNCIATGLLAGAPIVCTGGEEGKVRLWKAGGASLFSMVIMFESPPTPSPLDEVKLSSSTRHPTSFNTSVITCMFCLFHGCVGYVPGWPCEGCNIPDAFE